MTPRILRQCGCWTCLFLPLFSSALMAQMQFGPQTRLDQGTGTLPSNETAMASTHFLPDEILAAWNDFRRSPPNPSLEEQKWNIGVAITNNGGTSWSESLVRPPSAPINYQTDLEGDPMTAYDERTGILWVGGVAVGPAGQNSTVYVARKNLGQSTYQPSVVVESSTSFLDKCWMASGPAPGNPNVTNVYVAYNEFGATFATKVARSIDMGDNWTTAVGPVQGGIGLLPRVGPNGELYITYWNRVREHRLLRSFDGGQTFDNQLIATRIDHWSEADGSRFPGWFRVPPLGYLAIDGNDGTLYFIYFDTTSGIPPTANVDLWFTKSTNQGVSWTVPVIMNTDSVPPGDQFWPWIEVDKKSNLHVVFLNSRHNTTQTDNDEHGWFDAYYAFSYNGGTTWQEYRLTSTSFDSYYDGLNRIPSVSQPPEGGQFLGDYLGLGRAGCTAYPCYISTHEGVTHTYYRSVTYQAACCTGLVGDCQLLTECACADLGGTWKPNKTTCTPQACPPAYGPGSGGGE